MRGTEESDQPYKALIQARPISFRQLINLRNLTLVPRQAIIFRYLKSFYLTGTICIILKKYDISYYPNTSGLLTHQKP
jgi:hypothetical protein